MRTPRRDVSAAQVRGISLIERGAEVAGDLLTPTERATIARIVAKADTRIQAAVR